MLLMLTLPVHAWEAGEYDPQQSEVQGRAIAEKVKDANRPSKDLVIKAVMTLKSKDSIVDTRKIIIKQKTCGSLNRVLFRFMDSHKRGTTFLTIETGGPENDQYLFIPSLGRPRKIAASDRQNDFEDTDFTHEDLGGRNIDDYAYRRRKDTATAGGQAYKAAAMAKDPSARFPKHIALVDAKSLIPVQITVYGKDNAIQKVLAAGDIREIGGIHIPFKWVAKNMKPDHTTIIEVVDAVVNGGVEAADFDPAQMGATWKEAF